MQLQVPSHLLDSLKSSTDSTAVEQPSEQVGQEAEGTEQQEVSGQEQEEASDTPIETTDAQATQGEESPGEPVQVQSKEELLITGPDGKKQKIEVDWNDKEKLKKYIHAAAGMRKFQAERDNALRNLKEKEAEYKDISSSWNAVKSAYETEGLKGIVNLLTQREDGYDTWINQELLRLQKRQDASPEELRQMDLEERLAKEQQARERLEKQVKETLEKATKEKQDATQAEAQARVSPIFAKYSFSDKLGDAGAEEFFNKALWSQTVERISKSFPEDADIPEAILDKEFRATASTLQKYIKTQTEKKTQQVINNKKQQAATQAATMATKGFNSQGNAKENIKKAVESGNLKGALAQFFGTRT